MLWIHWRVSLVACSLLLAANTATAGMVKVTVTNHGNSSFSLTPLWFGFHGGGFDLFNPGSGASSSLEALAEEGVVSGLLADFSATSPGGVQGVVLAPGGFPGAPIIEPGESATVDVDVDAMVNRFFSFASMIIPSNDTFIGTPSPVEVFDTSGNLLGGSRTINIFGRQLWDSGTEVNNTMGAAFSTIPGTATDENGVVHLLQPPGLDNFLNSETPAGRIVNLIGPDQLVASITISGVPEPSTIISFSGLVGMLLWRRRRRL